MKTVKEQALEEINTAFCELQGIETWYHSGYKNNSLLKEDITTALNTLRHSLSYAKELIEDEIENR